MHNQGGRVARLTVDPVSPRRNATPMRTALPGRGRQCTQFFSEGAIHAERHIAVKNAIPCTSVHGLATLKALAGLASHNIVLQGVAA